MLVIQAGDPGTSTLDARAGGGDGGLPARPRRAAQSRCGRRGRGRGRRVHDRRLTGSAVAGLSLPLRRA